jgi:hypothetical protein
LCEIAATAGYRRLENQLYRVEVHEGGASPTFKWSRENGSVAAAFSAGTLPMHVLVDRHGRIVARSGVVDAPFSQAVERLVRQEGRVKP